MNAPIHFHGTREFMLGEVETLRTFFTAFSSQVTLHEWGNPSDPIRDLYPFPGYWPLLDRPAYILDIWAIKDRLLPVGYSNHGATSGKLTQLLNYPFSYNLYRVLRKAGFFS